MLSGRMVALVTYGDENFSESRDRLAASARKYGIPAIFVYSRKELVDSDFYRENRKILDQPKGGGYWLWKPYFILKTLEMLNDGDVLIYSDSGSEIIASMDEFIEISTRNTDVAVFSTRGFQNKYWTKRDVFAFLGIDSEEYWNMEQIWAMYIVIRKSDVSMEFVKEWLRVSSSEDLITDAPTMLGKPEFPELIMHKHDQSILSVLSAKYGITPHRLPSQHGNGFMGDFPEDTYPQIFRDHHLRNLSLNSGIGAVWLFFKRDLFDTLKLIKSMMQRVKFIPKGICNSIFRRVPTKKSS
jgi:hypothetical protein